MLLNPRTTATLKERMGSKYFFTWTRVPIVNYMLESERWSLCFVCSYAPLIAHLMHSITNKEQHKELLYAESRSLQKMQMKNMTKPVPYHSIMSCKMQIDSTKDKGYSMICVLYTLQLVKRHISGRSNVEQWRNQTHSPFLCWVMLGWRYQFEGSPTPTQNSIKVYESPNINGFQNIFLYCFAKYLWIYNDF